MTHFAPKTAYALADFPPPEMVTMSPLVLADRLLTLAKDADRGGFAGTADRLLNLAYAIWDNAPGALIISTPRLADRDPW